MISDESDADRFDKLALRMAIETLDEEKRQIVYLRYFKDYSQSETAKLLGLSQVKISREEKKIIAHLRSKM
jgi:RNA polymerase sporulation-specific sigma factor